MVGLSVFDISELEGASATGSVTDARVYWEVWFRDEYFGHVAEEIIDDVVLVMMDHGGFVRDPARRRLESMHSRAGYGGMVRAIVARLNVWDSGPLSLTGEDARTEV